MVNRFGQMKIQQMAFMIVAVFFFFILVGLFFLSWQTKSVHEGHAELQKEQTLSSLKTLTDMSELNCDGLSNCVDADKLIVMGGVDYSELWPVSSIEVYKIYPAFNSSIKCPAKDCNYYYVYDSGQKNTLEYSTYVSICKKNNIGGYVYDECEIGKLVAGVKGGE